jgi:hypothetical protein
MPNPDLDPMHLITQLRAILPEELGAFAATDEAIMPNPDLDPMHLITQLRAILPEELGTFAAAEPMTDPDVDPMRHFMAQLRVILAELYAATKSQ